MKYLRRYNEAVDKNKLSQLKDFCDGYLAYLMDEGFTTEVKDSYHDRRVMGIGDKPKGNYKSNEAIIIIKGVNKFSWDSVKDNILPFLQMLSKNYPIKHNKIAFRNTYNLGWSTKKSEYTLEYLLKDGLVNDDNLSQIELRVQL